MQNSKKAAFFVGLHLLVAASCDVLAAEPTVVWPHGWMIRDAGIPTNGSRANFSESNRVALKLNEQGQTLAAIGLTELGRDAGDSPRLEGITQLILRTMESEYSDKGFKASCDAPSPTSLGTLPALQSLCELRQNDVVVVERMIIIATGRKSVFSFSYTAPRASFDTYMVDFVTVRDGLHLD
jgi:hypothetical protein